MLQGMRWTALNRLLVGAGLLALVAAVALALLPMHGNGLAGNAVRPRYGPFGFYTVSSQPVPAHPTSAELRRLGVTLPEDLVRSRRFLAGSVGATGVAATALGLLLWRRPPGIAAQTGEPWPS